MPNEYMLTTQPILLENALLFQAYHLHTSLNNILASYFMGEIPVGAVSFDFDKAVYFKSITISLGLLK